MHKIFYNAPCCCLCILGVKGHRGLQFQGVSENMMISTYHVVSRFTASSHLQCDSAENANETGKTTVFIH